MRLCAFFSPRDVEGKMGASRPAGKKSMIYWRPHRIFKKTCKSGKSVSGGDHGRISVGYIPHDRGPRLFFVAIALHRLNGNWIHVVVAEIIVGAVPVKSGHQLNDEDHLPQQL